MKLSRYHINYQMGDKTSKTSPSWKFFWKRGRKGWTYGIPGGAWRKTTRIIVSGGSEINLSSTCYSPHTTQANQYFYARWEFLQLQHTRMGKLVSTSPASKFLQKTSKNGGIWVRKKIFLTQIPPFSLKSLISHSNISFLTQISPISLKSLLSHSNPSFVTQIAPFSL